MPSPTVGALLTELDAASTVVLPRIRGLEALTNDNLSGDLLQLLNVELARLRRLEALYGTARNAVQDLADESFPDLPDTEIPPAIFAELERQETAIMLAVEGFAPIPPATTIAVELGDPSPKE